MSALSTLLAVLSLDGTDYLDGLSDSEDAASGFGDKLSKIGGAVVAVGLTAVVTAVMAVGVAAWDAGNAVDGAMDQIATKTGATGPALQGLQDDLKAVATAVPTDLDKAAAAVGGLNSQLHLSGPALQELAKPLLEVTRLTGGDITANTEAFGRVIGDWSLPTDQAAGSLDKLFKLSQASGAPMDQLLARIVQYGAPMRGFGMSFDDTAALMAKWQAEGVNVETVMGGLRIAAGKFTKDGVDMKTGLWDTVNAIKGAASSTDALTIATQAFGAKAAVDMVDTIRGGKFDIDKLVESMQNADGTIMQTAANTMDWGEQWKIFQNKMTFALAPMGQVLMRIAGQALAMLTAFLDRPEVQDFIQNLTQWIETLATTVETWVPLIGQWLTDAWTWLLDHQEVIVAALAILTVAIVAWAITSALAIAPLIIEFLPIIAVLLLIGVVAGLLYLAWVNNWGGIQDKTKAVWAWLEPILKGIWEWLSVKLSEAGKILADFWQKTLWPAIVSGWDWLMIKLGEFATWLGIVIPIAIQALADFWTGVLWPAIKSVWDWLSTVLLPFIISLSRALTSYFLLGLRSISAIIDNVLMPAFKALVGYLSAQMDPAFADFLRGINIGFMGSMKNLANFLGTELKKAFEGITMLLQDLTKYLDGLSKGLDNLKLPDWMTPGSPTPWQLGLEGVSGAMAELTSTQMPKFAAQLDLQPTAGTLGIDAQPRSAASFSGGAAAGGAEQDGLLNELRQLLRDLPRAMAQATRDAVLKVSK